MKKYTLIRRLARVLEPDNKLYRHDQTGTLWRPSTSLYRRLKRVLRREPLSKLTRFLQQQEDMALRMGRS